VYRIADLKGSLAGEQFKNQNLHRELNDNKRELEQLKDENQTLSVSAEEWVTSHTNSVYSNNCVLVSSLM
jgi:hypothetical protein